MTGEELASSVQEVMMEEWEQLRSEDPNLPLFPDPAPLPGGRHPQKRRASFPDCSPSVAKRASHTPDHTLSSDDNSLVGASMFAEP